MSDGTTSVEDAIDDLNSSLEYDYSNAQNITNSLPFTAPKNGVAILIVGSLSSSGPGVRQFFINGTVFAIGCCTFMNTVAFPQTITLPLNKNDILSSDYPGFGTYLFVPCK